MFDFIPILIIIFSVLGFPIFIFASVIKLRSKILKIIFISLSLLLAMSSIYLFMKLQGALILWAYVASAFGLIGAIGLSLIRRTKKIRGREKALSNNIVRGGINFFGSVPLVISFAISLGVAMFYSVILILVGNYTFPDYVVTIQVFLYVVSIGLIFLALFFLASE